jgi:predicted flap endonuclease-1-like 5' DNA nuclease
MSHLVLELALWILLAFFIGCIIGCILHKLFGGEATTTMARGTPPRAAVDEPSRIPGAETVKAAGIALATEEEVASTAGKPARPQGIAQARGGRADNLQRISGIGPKNEKTLHGLGFFHFDQIAAWSQDEVAWVDDHLKFNGRIQREEWINQAKLLAEGKEDEFHKLYGTGGLQDKKGETESGSRTRKD